MNKSAANQCLNIYPKDMGGVKFETKPDDAIDKTGDRWQRVDNGQFYYVNKWDKQQNKLVSYSPLPETIEISADYVARMIACPYLDLKRLKTGLADTLKGWIPVAVLIAAIIFLIIVGG